MRRHCSQPVATGQGLESAGDERLGDRFAAAFRRWEQAAEALDASEESEEIQAVGMRCRECLLVFIENTARQDMIAEGTEPPKKGDFIHWSEIIADKVAAGSTRQELRGYLKAIARSTWQLVSWLTHATNLGRHEGRAALDATYAVLNAFGAAVLGVERPITDRCGRCGSVRLQTIYRPEFDSDTVECLSCGWSDAEVHRQSRHRTAGETHRRPKRRRHKTDRYRNRSESGDRVGRHWAAPKGSGPFPLS